MQNLYRLVLIFRSRAGVQVHVQVQEVKSLFLNFLELTLELELQFQLSIKKIKKVFILPYALCPLPYLVIKKMD